MRQVDADSQERMNHREHGHCYYNAAGNLKSGEFDIRECGNNIHGPIIRMVLEHDYGVIT